VKIPLYAMADIPEVWIVDLEGESVEIYRAPTPTNYSSVNRYHRGESVCPSAFPDLHLSVDEIFA
jgi:Uma2 family endonuclease